MTTQFKYRCYLCDFSTDDREMNEAHKHDEAFTPLHDLSKIIREVTRDWHVQGEVAKTILAGADPKTAVSLAMGPLISSASREIEDRWALLQRVRTESETFAPDLERLHEMVASLVQWVRDDPEQDEGEYLTQFGLYGDGPAYERIGHHVRIEAMVGGFGRPKMGLSLKMSDGSSRWKIDGTSERLQPFTRGEIEAVITTVQRLVPVTEVWGAYNTKEAPKTDRFGDPIEDPVNPWRALEHCDFISMTTDLDVGPNVAGLYARYGGFTNGGRRRLTAPPPGWR